MKDDEIDTQSLYDMYKEEEAKEQYYEEKYMLSEKHMSTNTGIKCINCGSYIKQRTDKSYFCDCDK